MPRDAAPAVPALLEALQNDEDASVRSYAFQALTTIEPFGESTLPTVRLVLKDPDPTITQTALRELAPRAGAYSSSAIVQELRTPARRRSLRPGEAGYSASFMENVLSGLRVEHVRRTSSARRPTEC